MGRGKGGVIPHRNGVQLTLYYRGERLRPTLRIDPTPANMRYAERVLAEIRAKIKAGTFEPSDYFPEYRRLVHIGSAPVKTFNAYSEAFLESGKATLSPSTLDVYRKVLDGFWVKKFDQREMRSITHSEVAAIMGGTPWKSLKTHNNWLSCLRRVFALAMKDGLKQDPTEGIKPARLQKPEPDPFTPQEVEAIIEKLRERTEAYADYFEYAFFAGMRPSEQIALLWPDVDLQSGLAVVRRARVVTVDKETTKTSTRREVEHNARALGALKRQAARSRLANGEVWINPRTLKPYRDEQCQYNEFGTVLRLLGIRYRPPYQCRHTCATMMLMAGANPAWCARQLGHSPEMFWKVYAKWIDGADKGRELNKVNLHLTATKTATSGG